MPCMTVKGKDDPSPLEILPFTIHGAVMCRRPEDNALPPHAPSQPLERERNTGEHDTQQPTLAV